MQLSNQHWLTDPKTQKLVSAFGEVGLRFVGGVVRDAIMGREVGDIDCATQATPKQVIALLKSENIKAIPTGIEHGTITAVIDGTPFEITTLRRDVACDGRHAEVEYTTDWQEDAMRRDFTLNALYCDANGHVYDYTNGIEAAKAGRIEFIGDARARITEDALRVLRFFRFFATHGQGTPDANALTACAALKGMLADLSGERIQREMFKLLATAQPQAALAAMQSSGVLGELIPDASLEIHSLHPHALLRLALMLPNAQAAKELAARWKLSKRDHALLTHLKTHPYSGWPTSDLEMLTVARHLTPEHYALLLWRNASLQQRSHEGVSDILTQFWALKIPTLPVTGNDLLARGIPAGKQIGATLRQLDAQWEASGYTLSKEELLR